MKKETLDKIEKAESVLLRILRVLLILILFVLFLVSLGGVVEIIQILTAGEYDVIGLQNYVLVYTPIAIGCMLSLAHLLK
jgi:lipopolysaccharide export LptBFGC system permease protein LptF